MVTGSRPGTDTKRLVVFGSSGAPRRRLFCLPFAGGGPATYRLWHKTLPSDVQVVAVLLPGRGPSSGEHPPDSVEKLVQTLLPAIEAADDLPYAFFGHSMGALLAFELTVALESSGASRPDHLFVSSRRAPDEVHRGEMIHALPDSQFLNELDRHFGGVPDMIRNEPDLLKLLLPGLRADVRAFETYRPLTTSKVGCPVHVYGGADDVRPRPVHLDGWQRVADQQVSIRLFPGDHFYLNQQREALTADIAARWPAVSLPSRPS
jgi:surfactin synthase thioesterase subunit